MAEGFDKKWLEGIKYRSSKAKTTEKDGRKLIVHEPTERALREGDVLAWHEHGDGTVTLVTADGQKITVSKPAEKKA
ncbi:MAG: hypothetical protein IH614_06235 [Desulfuromonadales bacterium]|nr:hypothetical protein [Desulfuromonadales bacterium]